MGLTGALGLLSMVAAPTGAQLMGKTTLSLSEAESIALENSDSLRIRKLRNQSAAERVRLGVRAYLPEIQLGFTTGRTVNSAARDSGTDRLTLTVKQSLYNGGRTRMQRSLSALRLNLDRHSYRVAREDLLNSVYNAFYRVLVLQAQREVKRRTLDDARQRLAIAQTKLGIGMIREIDMLDAELSVDSREIDLQSTESDLEEAMYSLKKAVGLSPEREITLEGEIDTEYRGIEIRWSAAQFLVLAEKRNLDLQNARFNVRRQEVQARLVRNRYLPHVTANVTFSVSGRNFPLQTAGATVGLDISFPEAETPVQASLSGGTSGAASGSRNGSLTVNPVQSITARIDRADAQTALERARSDERSLRRDLSFRIVKQISGYRRRQQTIALERRSLSLENKKLFILEQQVANGTATQVDYLKEQIAVENVEVRLLGDILVLIKQERSLERLAGLDPGELAGAQGGGHGRN